MSSRLHIRRSAAQIIEMRTGPQGLRRWSGAVVVLLVVAGSVAGGCSGAAKNDLLIRVDAGKHDSGSPPSDAAAADDADVDMDGSLGDASAEEDANAPFSCGTETCTAEQLCSETIASGGGPDGGSATSSCVKLPEECTTNVTCPCVQAHFTCKGSFVCKEKNGRVRFVCRLL
jgi:hypothetical protein